MKNLIIADMDGTILDSMPFLSSLGVAVLIAAADINEHDAWTFYQSTVGMPFMRQLKEWNIRCRRDRLDVSEIDSVVGMSKLYARAHKSAAPLFKMTSFGHQLTQHRFDPYFPFQLALVTSTTKDIVDATPLLSCIKWNYIGGHDGGGFGKLEQIQVCLDTLQRPITDVIYVGDSRSDRDIAQLCGFDYRYPTDTLLRELRTELGDV